LRRAAPEPEAIAGYADAFSPAYQARNTPEEALSDIGILKGLADEQALALRLGAQAGGGLRLKIYHQKSPIALSDRVPMLENFGFRVIDERTYTVQSPQGEECFVHDMALETVPGVAPPDGDLAIKTENAILAVWRGEAESDGLNQLTPKVGLSWYDVELLRALTKYLRQVGISFTRSYLSSVIANHP